ncbi:dienelactone hydrolase family protein [Metallosphaera hakonensis]|uniref:Carboxymethylenebutenolidase n=1 Tax=Metallosphaera hakonensis JCM 8857 = DSM 7519 TaxID=1293036 RepID=A0A2U9IWA0_9CREN|nr:dienelactone hydrolase family protein [Metallosphaera hakonensis]AWS00319.1 dienelactone hydrolase family protein [Metallosphaera hakonensis JCM 8857 = DSM 7519]
MEEKVIRFPSFDGNEVDGFLVNGGNKAGIIVISEIWGITEYIRNVARRLAGLGYVALAPNLYSRNKDFNEQTISGVMRRFFSLPPEKRGDKEAISKLVEGLSDKEKKIYEELVMNRVATEDRMLKDLEHTYEYLKSMGLPKIGSIGFCMGGGLAFQISTQVPIDATVVYYGRNPRNLEDIARIKGPVLAHYAGEDSAINQGVPDMVRAMIQYKKELDMKIYPGTYHAFATEGGQVYNETAARDAWDRTVRFYTKILG